MATGNATQSWLPSSFSQLVTLAGRGKLVRAASESGSGLFMNAEDQRLSQLAQEKHSPDGRHLDLHPLLHLIEDIFARATNTVNQRTEVIDHTARRQLTEEGSAQAGFVIVGGDVVDLGFDATLNLTLDELPLTIERVSCEMGCKCLGGEVDAHDAALSILGLLSKYPWEAKLVVTLAAFSVNYGEFLLLSQVYSTNPLAQSMALLKRLPSILQAADGTTLKRQLDAIGGLIAAMLNVTKLVVEFSELPAEYVTPEEPSVKAVISQFPLTVYWIIRSAVAAATQISLITTTTNEFLPSTTELELSNWTGKLNLIFDFLSKMKISVQTIIDAKLDEEAYNKIWKIVFNLVHQNNMTVMKTLIYSKDDVLPLFDGSTNKRVPLDVLLGQTVLLFITGLDVDHDLLATLDKIYKESNAYRIVWVPVVDRSITWSNSMQARLDELKTSMPWYSVHHPSLVSSAAIKFYNQGLNYKGTPVLVSFDTQGKVTSMNAFHMMWIWKNDAFPFSNAKEESLWKHESLRLELLVDNIDKTVSQWVKDDKYIYLYGGEDIDWIRKFTKVAKNVGLAAKINLELVYVGKSCKKETVNKITEIMEGEKLGYYLKDPTSMWFFWTRLESMLSSKIQLNMVDDESDKVTQEIKKIISYDKNVGGWAVICKGSQVFCSVLGTIIYDVLSKYDEWKGKVDQVGGVFHLALLDTIVAQGPENTCFRFEFLTTAGNIPKAIKCPECQNHMQNYVTFKCCHDSAAAAKGPPKTRASPIAI